MLLISSLCLYNQYYSYNNIFLLRRHFIEATEVPDNHQWAALHGCLRYR